MNEKIGVIGLWHLGCVISVSWSKLGYSVAGFDYDNQRINNLNKSIPPLFEPNLKEEIRMGLVNKRLSFSNEIKSLKDCDFVFLSYDTPVNEDDKYDTTILENSIRDVAKVLKNEAIVVISSQSPVGYCSKFREILKRYNSSCEIAYSPENLRLGEAIQCYLNPGRIILGTANTSTEKNCKQLFNKITDQILCMSLESAEMVKHGINSFLSMSIVFTNQLADICEEKNARIDDVVLGLKSDSRIGNKAYLSPGIGFSGGTLGRDLRVLESVNIELSGSSGFFGYVHKINSERKLTLVKRIQRIIGNLKDKKIGVLGLTYKPGTSTLRRSLPLEIVAKLLEEKACLSVFDPKADYSELNNTNWLKVENSIYDILTKNELVIVLTEWPEFKQFDWAGLFSQFKNVKIFDAKNCLDEKKMKESGYKYFSVGRY